MVPNGISKLKVDDSSNSASQKNSYNLYPTNNNQFTNFAKSNKMAKSAFRRKFDDIGGLQVEFRIPGMKSNLFVGLIKFEAYNESFKDIHKRKGKKNERNLPFSCG